MKTLWFGVAMSLAPALADAQSTIYKHVDESGRVTYTNRPMKGAIVVDLEPLSTIPGFVPPGGAAKPPEKPAAQEKPSPQDKPATPEKPAAKTAVAPAVAVVTPRGLANAVASVDRDTQKDRDVVRRRILEDELAQEEKSLAQVRKSILQEQKNPTLIAAVRVAQQAAEPTPSQQAEMRAAIDKASGRIRGLQATAAEHEKNIEAIKKELGALKP